MPLEGHRHAGDTPGHAAAVGLGYRPVRVQKRDQPAAVLLRHDAQSQTQGRQHFGQLGLPIAAAVEVMDQLGWLDEEQRAELQAWRAPVIRSIRGAAVGERRPVFRLQEA
ncbi:hypothetical protein [Ramlibacter humi]|uniref:Uncharacterized protein n=1 Tax=Ramlibacter humi TaxID=2530451 RepID=A0A4Z0BIV2_9BURK|nr:hypothetical protein [Ramlibacter humi]TFY98339.1 hypothetical protein EZ216_17280 [Ramlibacter humi]